MWEIIYDFKPEIMRWREYRSSLKMWYMYANIFCDLFLIVNVAWKQM